MDKKKNNIDLNTLHFMANVVIWWCVILADIHRHTGVTLC